MCIDVKILIVNYLFIPILSGIIQVICRYLPCDKKVNTYEFC